MLPQANTVINGLDTVQLFIMAEPMVVAGQVPDAFQYTDAVLINIY